MAFQDGYREKKLFTPGPLGTSSEVKRAMLFDLGSRDVNFIDTIGCIRRGILNIAGVSETDYTVVPLQGSGTYAVEAVLQTATPRNVGKILILANGAYGKRMQRICQVAGIENHTLSFPEHEPVDVSSVKAHLESVDDYDVVAVVHCETTTGIINPVEAIGTVVRQLAPNSSYCVDAMSSFGAVPLNVVGAEVDFLVSSANKCLEGVPGFSYAIARKKRLLECKGNCRSFSLDLVDQYEGLEINGQFRFTPPTHTMLAFRKALQEFDQEGGLSGRAKRYKENNAILRAGMKGLGFKELLQPDVAGYIITTFHYPKNGNFDFTDFYARLNGMDQVIYPGKLTNADCFRIGNIGKLYPGDMEHLIECIKAVCQDMNLPVPLA